MASCRFFALLLAVCMAVAPAFAATPSHSAAAALVPVDSSEPGSAQNTPAEGAMEAPREGEYAPDFELPTMNGADVVRLSQFRGNRAVLLVFGSYT